MPAPLPPPEEVRATFAALLASDPEKAVGYLHDLGRTSGYLEAEARSSSIRWTSESTYGTLECTINLAKPEKDPRAIAAAATSSPHALPLPSAQAAPQCDLCWENEGFAGTAEHPARPGLRIAAIALGGERWGLQYSPYAYFDEHCIALSETHRPMKIDEPCFERLLDFVDTFPFYFIGANADLPLVGGSILSHDHFQGGRHEFPLMRAAVERTVPLVELPNVRCGIVAWPASVLRLASPDRTSLVQAAARIHRCWQTFFCEQCGIAAFSTSGNGRVPHNTLNPIVRKAGGTYLMDLVLRNNRTDAWHPWGIFHPDDTLHHLKKENIGLIEIMGLAILPPRLARELPLVQRALLASARQGASIQDLEALLNEQPLTVPHAQWAANLYARRAAELAEEGASGSGCSALGRTGAQNLQQDRTPAAQQHLLHPVLQQEVGRSFTSVLEATGVFKRDATGAAGWNAFIEDLNRIPL